MDSQILSLLRFFPVNYAAADKLASRNLVAALPDDATGPSPEDRRSAHEWLDAKLRELPTEQHLWLLGGYANGLLRASGIDVQQLQDPLAEEAAS